jgi:hypothetical protein
VDEIMSERWKGKPGDGLVPNEQPIAEKPAVRIEIHAAPKGEWKALGGSDRDQWNERLSDLVIGALPVKQTDAEAVSQAGSAVAAGIVDTKPADPVEGMLISQLVVANEAALKLYQTGMAKQRGIFRGEHKIPAAR